ncbi:hypothetical protein K9M50_01365 [Patescibacteria group bacterium]|nr:hypothetical protein [Patescibacteria group bacterium]
MEEKNLNFKNKNALVFFADPDTEVICKHLAEKNDLSIINGYDILNEFESRKKLKTHQKVFLFITTYNFEDNHIKEIEKFGFKNDKITLFTTYSLDADI